MKHSIQVPAPPIAAFLLWSFMGPMADAQGQVPADACGDLGPANEYPVADPCVPVSFHTIDMDPSFNPGGCGATNGNDAWAWFTATTTETEVTYTVTGCAGFLCGLFTVPILHVFTGANCDSLELASCDLGTLGIGGIASVTIPTVVGEPYWVRIQRLAFNNDMDGTLCITPMTDAPPNDDCADATPVGNGTHPFTTVGSTGAYVSSCAWSDTNDVWFAYTATCNEQLRVTTCDDADFDTTISIFDACGGTEIACQDDHYGCANYTSTAIVNNVVAGTVYYIRIAGFEGATGSGNVTITCGPPPPPPANDDCALAVPIGDGIHPFNVESATGVLESSCSWMDTNDVWFAYTASCTGLTMVSTCGTAYFNTTLSVFDGCAGNELACSDDFPDCLFFTSATTFSTVQGQVYMIRVAGFNGDQGNGEIVIGCSPVTWYSQSSGNASDPIWSYTPVGPPEYAIFSHTMNVVVQNGHAVTQDIPTVEAMQFIVENGGSYGIGAGNSLSLSANLDISGDLDATEGDVSMDGTTTQLLIGTSTLELHDLIVNNPSTTIAQTDVHLQGTLLINAGTFDADDEIVTLVSNAGGSGRLGPVASGAAYAGDLQVRRWIPGGVTNWRLLGSPVAGATVSGWMDDFITAGFPGSHHPLFYDPPGSNNLWPSIRSYDEADPGPAPMDGLIGVASNLTPLTAGTGFAAWSGDNLGGTAPFTIDLTGAPHIAHNPIALPMSWTDTGMPGTDGWNLVSNPLPSPILFSALDRGTDVENAYHLFDPVSGNFATWNGMVGTLGATDTIQSSQGFYLKANGPAVTTTVNETAKVLAPLGGHFGGSGTAPLAAIRLRIHHGTNGFHDEAIVVFAGGQPGADPSEGDVADLPFSHPMAPAIATRAADGSDLSINMHGTPEGGLLIPVVLRTEVSGTYTISAAGMAGINGLSCLVLEDVLTGTRTPLHEGATYSLQLEADADHTQPRLLIHATAMLATDVQHASCHGMANGAITVENTTGQPLDLTWTNANGDEIATAMQMTGSTTIADLPAGTYQMVINGQECPAQGASFQVEQPWPIEVAMDVKQPSCAHASDGAVQVEVLGGTAPYELSWSNGSHAQLLDELANGEYELVVTDANGCIHQTVALVEAPAEIAGSIEAPPEALPMAPVHFNSTAPATTGHLWDLGDGTTSQAHHTVHSYAAPGAYTVSLMLDDGHCEKLLTHTVAVGAQAGIGGPVAAALHAWSAPGMIVLEGTTGSTDVQVLDATGRLVLDRQLAAQTDRTEFTTSGWPAGLYFLRTRSGGEEHTFALPVTH